MALRDVPYKELTLQQMRSFEATARLGSLSGAARALGIAQPTVWKQVRALEGAFGAKLLEPHARGVRLTPAGSILEGLLRPVLADVDALRRRWEEQAAGREPELRVAATPRVVDEDLPPCIAAFQERFPRAQVILRVAGDDEVWDLVDRGACELGLSQFSERHGGNPRLAFETIYKLEMLLVVPRAHPLARRRRIEPSVLGQHPMVTPPDAILDPGVRALLLRHRVFATPARVSVYRVAGIRRYVALGFGIGIIPSLLTPELRESLAQQGLVARSLSRHFGRLAVCAIRRAAAPLDPLRSGFLSLVRTTLAAQRV